MWLWYDLRQFGRWELTSVGLVMGFIVILSTYEWLKQKCLNMHVR